MSTQNPICLCGYTSDHRPIVGGAFYMIDTMGVPLVFLMDAAEKYGYVVSLPHFFACATVSGWRKQAFTKIDEALVDRGQAADMLFVQQECIKLFMFAAAQNPGKNVRQIATALRQMLESPENRSTPLGAASAARKA